MRKIKKDVECMYERVREGDDGMREKERWCVKELG